MRDGAQLTEDDLGQIRDPAALLELAWTLEPASRYGERAAALDALEQLLHAGAAPPPPPGRDWRLELLAERSIDVGRSRQLELARALVDEVRRDADPSHEIALARAMLGLGQALAWIGTDEATRQSNRAFAEAADRFAALGRREWQGSALLRRGYSACYQHGDLIQADALIREALETYPAGSSRIPGALGSWADVLIDLGELDQAQAALDRASEIFVKAGVRKVGTDLTTAYARIAARRGDARTTERLVREAEREGEDEDWFQTHIGLSFLLEAAELLDLVGISAQAARYLERARARAGDDNEEVMQTRAVLRARSGDPELALEELQELARGDWLEKRTIWRHTLLTAWATFRLAHTGAGELTAQALDQATAAGGVRVAQSGEPELVAALAPLAQAAGSAPARALMLDGRQLIVRLFGTPVVVAADGEVLPLPPGLPGQVVRLLALHEHGLPVDVILEAFFPETAPAAARQRLRQVLTRLRKAVGDIVVRDGETLRLVPAWVDVREFLAAANRVRGARGSRAVQLAYAAIARHSGPLLPTDPYAEWADEAREQVRYRYLALLDLVAADAISRGSHQEALTALEAAIAEEPEAEHRRDAVTKQLFALARAVAADDTADRR